VGSFGITVWSPQTGNPAIEQMGNTSFDLSTVAGNTPTANTIYSGTPLGGGTNGTGSTAYGNGNLWTIALYTAPGVNNTVGLLAAETIGTPTATALFKTSGGTGTANAGVNGADSAGAWNANPGTITLAGYTGGATVQLEAWYNGGSANLTYLLSPVKGTSAVESIAALGGTGSPPATTPNLGAATPGPITSFSLIGTPEPSTIALGVIGASTFLFRRRK
jgi:hypothetical protein